MNFINSFVIGKLNYMLPIYNIAPNYLKNKLHKIVMKGAHTAIGNYCYKKSTKYILDKCKWLSIDKMITYSSLVFIYNITLNKKPKGVLQIYKTNRFLRHKADLSLSHIPKNVKYSKFFIQEHTNTYNKIPSEIKSKSKKTFKKELKMWIQNQPIDTSD